MEIELSHNLEEHKWSEFLKEQSLATEMLQSKLWQTVMIKEGKEVQLFVWKQEKKIVALAQVIKQPSLFALSWYIPRGPIFANLELQKKYSVRIWHDLVKAANKEKVMAIRFESKAEEMGFKVQQVKAIQPEKTLFLDLTVSEEDLLKQMHQKTRYNIRLATKRGVKIEQGGTKDALAFYQLLKLTAQRDSFRVHSLKHYQTLLEVSPESIQIYLAKKEGKLLAAGIFSFYGGRATYLHGASANEGREHMAPYLLQWEMIKKAKSKAYRFYDFYGIDALKWPGVTRFKKGFGGQEISYSGTSLLVLRPSLYYSYSLAAYLKRKLKF
jgi:lipid II:glycine glycyltransferase (peptidoglycan interpeptide bridge formation enzyme)